jgi:hypothetical protein
MIKSPTLVLKATVGLLDEGKAGFILTEDEAQKIIAAISPNAAAKLVEIPDTNHFTILFDAAPMMVHELEGFFK